jgi:transposase
MSRVLEAIKSDNISEVARKYGLSVNLLCKWKKDLESGSESIFGSKKETKEKTMKRKVAQLEQLLGRKEVELNLVQNFLDFYQSENSI